MAGNAVSYVGTNAHGDLTWTATPAAIIAGTTSSNAVYDPFGNVVVSSGTLTAFRWQGSLYDTATSLYYARARWYSPSLGRFTSNDPVAGGLTDPTSLNPYAYAGGDPIVGSDPSGRTACYYGDCAKVGGSTSAVRSSYTAGSSPGIACYSGYCHAAGGKPTPATVAADKAMKKHAQQIAVQKANAAAAIRSGCPVAYCGTDEQKVANAKADLAMEATLKAQIAWNAQVEADARRNAIDRENQALSKAAYDANYAEAHKCDNHAIWDIGCTANDVNQAWQSTGGDFVNKNGAVIALAGVVVACGAGAVVTVGAVAAACLIGAGVGVAGYTGANAVNNYASGKGLLDGWDINQASVAGLAGAGQGMVCAASAGTACYLAGGFAATGVYHFSPGEHTPLGYLESFGLGAGFSWLGSKILSKIKLPGGGGCSFSPDTKVATPAGSTAIGSLRIGDIVIAYDPVTGKTGPHTVTAVMTNLDPVVEHLRFDSGLIETTPNHRFYTLDRGWVEAGSLVPGERIKTASGIDAIVVSFTLEATPSTMWDITVDGAHSFFVGQGAVLVHNCPPVEGPGAGSPINPAFKTVYNDGTLRLDWETPSNGSQNIHIQFFKGPESNLKFYFNPATGQFEGLSNSMNKALQGNGAFQSALQKAIREVGKR